MNRQEKKIALQKEIESRTNDLKSKARSYKDFGKDALLIGGVVVLGYSLFRLFADDENKPEEGDSSILGSTLKATASTVLLALAKEKLEEFLATSNEENGE